MDDDSEARNMFPSPERRGPNNAYNGDDGIDVEQSGPGANSELRSEIDPTRCQHLQDSGIDSQHRALDTRDVQNSHSLQEDGLMNEFFDFEAFEASGTPTQDAGRPQI
jgi:hypothetical protein